MIHAGAGGVDHFAVQFARQKGADVFVTASGDGKEFVRSPGAQHVIDYKKQCFEDVAQDMDLVFDLIGGKTQTRSWKVLKEGGALISTLTEPSKEEAAQRKARAARYTARPDGYQLAAIGELIDTGRVKVHLAETFPCCDAGKALARIEAGHVQGKIVVEMP